MPSEPFISEIFMAGMNFAPRGYASCDGQVLPIAQNTALFALLGTTFGGNGQTTFALPDLRGRLPMHYGTGPGLTARTMGEQSGQEEVILNTSQLPSHGHPLNAVSEPGDVSIPTGAYLANSGALDKEYKTAGSVVAMNTNAVGPAGGGLPHSNLPPFLVINFYIAIEGIFPSRN